jgi:REP element-mobilizing transposase RayT/CheY-like chemotaxis protein
MIDLLVVSSDDSFGELIRQNLEGTGRFQVHLAGDKGSAFSFIIETDCQLAFLDTGLSERDLLEIGAQARHSHPGMYLVVISDAGWHSALEELSPEDYLSKPFYLPDLMKMADKFFPEPQSTPGTPASNQAEGDPPWLSDVTRAAQHLTRLTLESSAQAALITRFDQLWAYAGQLPQSATGELADTVSRYWDRQEESDLVRFVHLASTGAEHMLYATRLTRNMVLALIFDAETPFSTIHTQANKLVHSLSTSLPEEQNEPAQTDEESPPASISAILSDIPSPNPALDAKMRAQQYLHEAKTEFPQPSMPPQRLNREASPEMPVTQPFGSEPEAPDLEKTLASAAVTRKSRTRKELTEEEAEVTRPSSANGAARKIILEPASPSVYNLDYACLLVPRFTQHLLIGDLSNCLPDWLQETCIAFGWRLEFISVRPEHLLWNVNVPPATSPGQMMRVLRLRTSEKIFDEFPRFKKENPSGDFWAPGYLIMGGSQPPPAHLIKEFVVQTRQRQGIYQQFR